MLTYSIHLQKMSEQIVTKFPQEKKKKKKKKKQ